MGSVYPELPSYISATTATILSGNRSAQAALALYKSTAGATAKSKIKAVLDACRAARDKSVAASAPVNALSGLLVMGNVFFVEPLSYTYRANTLAAIVASTAAVPKWAAAAALLAAIPAPTTMPNLLALDTLKCLVNGGLANAATAVVDGWVLDDAILSQMGG